MEKMTISQKIHVIDHVQNCIEREQNTIDTFYNLINALDECVAVANEMTIEECKLFDIVRGIAGKYGNEHNKTLNALYKFLGGFN